MHPKDASANGPQLSSGCCKLAKDAKRIPKKKKLKRISWKQAKRRVSTEICPIGETKSEGWEEKLILF